MTMNLLPEPGGTFEVKYGGAIFLCRRLRPSEDDNLRRKHTRRGETNWMELGFDRIRRIVTGWKGLAEEYRPELVERLPASCRQYILEVHDEGDPTEGPE